MIKILFVINNYFTRGNGLAQSARRTVKKLKERGYDVKVLSGGDSITGDKADFNLPDLHLPIFDPLVTKQGYIFAKAKKDIIIEAVKWADVIHLEEPFMLEAKVAKYAKKYNKPITATYHLHPENLFASVNLYRSRILNGITLFLWKKLCYNKCKIIQCPTKNVYDRLKKNKFKSELRIISNGLLLDDLMKKSDVKAYKDNKYRILAIGRYSIEKDYKTLIKAMKYSKFSEYIELIILGRGPKEKSLKKLANKYYKKGIIKNQVKFGFYNMDELQKISSSADLFIHCAFIEVEGLSLMEAVQLGIVPIIAKAKLSATSMFAKSDESIYKAKNPSDLASKIDYWLSNEELRIKEAEKYKNMAKDYDIEKSIDLLEVMFNDAYNK